MKPFIFGKKITAKADIKIDNKTAKMLWHKFTFDCGEIDFEKGEANTFIIGNACPPQLSKDAEYSVKVDENGIAIAAHDYGGLMRGFIHILKKIEYTSLEENKESFYIEPLSENKIYPISERMVHYCVFPETDLNLIKRQIRFAALLHFNYVCLEFWGTLKFDCLNELAWPDAFTKEQVRELATEIKELGLEAIPFFNHLGHASASKISNGKHVVLNQNPKLQYLFMGDGWEWNIANEKVKTLFRSIRKELCEIFGEGKYFHIGCDEAYMILNDESLKPLMADFVNELTNEVEKEGRIPLLWADMYISRKELTEVRPITPDFNVHNYWAPLKDCSETDFQLKALSENSILIDWQYDVEKAPFRSFLTLKDKGYKAMVAPWQREKNCVAAFDTVVDYGAEGIMCTTWGVLDEPFYGMLKISKLLKVPNFSWSDAADRRAEVGTLFRKATFENLPYNKIGMNNK